MAKEAFNMNIRGTEPLPPVQDYDVHIYFETGKLSEKNAVQVVEKMKTLFPQAVNDVHLMRTKGGPHTAPNFGVNIKPESFGAVVSWLQRNNLGLSILIHPHTGDDLTDHLESAMWLGAPVALNIGFFRPSTPKGPKL